MLAAGYDGGWVSGVHVVVVMMVGVVGVNVVQVHAVCGGRRRRRRRILDAKQRLRQNHAGGDGVGRRATRRGGGHGSGRQARRRYHSYTLTFTHPLQIHNTHIYLRICFTDVFCFCFVFFSSVKKYETTVLGNG